MIRSLRSLPWSIVFAGSECDIGFACSQAVGVALWPASVAYGDIGVEWAPLLEHVLTIALRSERVVP